MENSTLKIFIDRIYTFISNLIFTRKSQMDQKRKVIYSSKKLAKKIKNHYDDAKGDIIKNGDYYISIYLTPVINSVHPRIDMADFYAKESMKIANEIREILPYEGTKKVRLLAQLDGKKKEKIKTLYPKCIFHVLSYAQSMHSVADILLNLILLAAGFDEKFIFGEKDITGEYIQKDEKIIDISKELENKRGSKIINNVDGLVKEIKSLIESPEFKYLNAFTNTIKHRQLLVPSWSRFVVSNEREIEETPDLKMPGFHYKKVEWKHIKENYPIKLMPERGCPNPQDLLQGCYLFRNEVKGLENEEDPKNVSLLIVSPERWVEEPLSIGKDKPDLVKGLKWPKDKMIEVELNKIDDIKKYIKSRCRSHHYKSIELTKFISDDFKKIKAHYLSIWDSIHDC